MSPPSLLFLFFFSILSALIFLTAATSIGVTYSSSTTTPTTPNSVISATTSIGLTTLRLPDPSPQLTRAFAYTNITLLLSIPNALIPSLALNRSNALHWLYTHVLPFYPRVKITTISVGNDVIDYRPDITHYLLPAIRNVYKALQDLGIRKIKVSSTFSFVHVMQTSFPPSSARFQEPFGSKVVQPLLQFLEDTNSSFLINVYPYNVYRLNCEIPIGFALFQEYPFSFRDDVVTGTRYWNLFDVMVDAVITAMAVLGHENIPIIVAETGWPSTGGDSSEADATEAYAEMYLKGLLKHLKSGIGTPLRRDGVAEAYVYELVDKDAKMQDDANAVSTRNWGIMYPNMTMKYAIKFSGARLLCGNVGLTMLGVLLSWYFCRLKS